MQACGSAAAGRRMKQAHAVPVRAAGAIGSPDRSCVHRTDRQQGRDAPQLSAALKPVGRLFRRCAERARRPAEAGIAPHHRSDSPPPSSGAIVEQHPVSPSAATAAACRRERELGGVQGAITAAMDFLSDIGRMNKRQVLLQTINLGELGPMGGEAGPVLLLGGTATALGPCATGWALRQLATCLTPKLCLQA